MKSVKRLISKVKFNAYKLKEGGQIPPSLFLEICSLDDLSSIEDVRCLMWCCDHLTRIKGYYFRFHESELGIDIKRMIKEYKESTRKGKSLDGECS